MDGRTWTSFSTQIMSGKQYASCFWSATDLTLGMVFNDIQISDVQCEHFGVHIAQP